MPRGTEPEAQPPPTKYRDLHALLRNQHPDAASHAFLDHRWLDAVIGARRTMKATQRWYRLFGAISLSAAAVLPVLVTASTQSDGDFRTALSVVAILTSLLVAGTTGFLQAVNPGARWRLHRELRDRLEAEAWALAVRRSPYNAVDVDGPKAFATFVDRVEVALETHNTQYRRDVAGVLSRSGETSSSDESTPRTGLA